MLKDIVDETSWGRYDFMYLRIGEHGGTLILFRVLTESLLDFANNCKSVYTSDDVKIQDTNPGSVGYAFINFEDVSPSSRGQVATNVRSANVPQPYYIIEVNPPCFLVKP